MDPNCVSADTRAASQVTATFVTDAFVIAPVPPVIVQICPEGCCAIVMVYGVPLASVFANVKLVAPAETLTLGSPGVASTSPEPTRPAMLPPTWYSFVAQVTVTLVTSPSPTVP